MVARQLHEYCCEYELNINCHHLAFTVDKVRKGYTPTWLVLFRDGQEATQQILKSAPAVCHCQCDGKIS